MIEAVGHEHMEAYFRTLGAMVKPGGRVVIQVGGRWLRLSSTRLAAQGLHVVSGHGCPKLPHLLACRPSELEHLHVTV